MLVCRLSLTSSKFDLLETGKALGLRVRDVYRGVDYTVVRHTARKYVAVFKTSSIETAVLKDMALKTHGLTVKLTYRNLKRPGTISVCRFVGETDEVIVYQPKGWVLVERGVDVTYIATRAFGDVEAGSEAHLLLLSKWMVANKLTKFLTKWEVLGMVR